MLGASEDESHPNHYSVVPLICIDGRNPMSEKY